MYGEHLDDHQMELAVKLRSLKGIFVVDGIENLKTTVLEVREGITRNLIVPTFSDERKRLLNFIKDYVHDSLAYLKR
jgi:UDP-N-acetylglucosamine transferase subunit ALG13